MKMSRPPLIVRRSDFLCWRYGRNVSENGHFGIVRDVDWKGILTARIMYSWVSRILQGNGAGLRTLLVFRSNYGTVVDGQGGRKFFTGSSENDLSQ